MQGQLPTPFEVLFDPITFVVLGMYAAVWLAQWRWPARELPSVPWWRVRGFVAFAVYFFASTYLPLLWDARLGQYRLFDLTHVHPLAGAAVGILVYEAFVYFWHRLLHSSDLLWRGAHQMHHSAERIDAEGAFYFSPMDMIGWTLLGSLAMVVVVGLGPQAATTAVLVTTFFGIFQHANLRTPRWLGYFIQRPESHALHHARGEHRNNYSDLPVFDMLFGTFENPEHAPKHAGFYLGASARVWDMLRFKDVSRPASHRSRNTLRSDPHDAPPVVPSPTPE